MKSYRHKISSSGFTVCGRFKLIVGEAANSSWNFVDCPVCLKKRVLEFGFVKRIDRLCGQPHTSGARK